MESLFLEALRFGTAILAEGLVAVIAQRIAFGHARALQRAEAAARAAAIRRSLVAELQEAVTALERRATEAWPARPTRLTWADPCSVNLGAARKSVMAAYRELELFSMRVDQSWKFSQLSTGSCGILHNTAHRFDPRAAIETTRQASRRCAKPGELVWVRRQASVAIARRRDKTSDVARELWKRPRPADSLDEAPDAPGRSADCAQRQTAKVVWLAAERPGFDRFVAKPVSPSQLRGTARAVAR